MTGPPLFISFSRGASEVKTPYHCIFTTMCTLMVFIHSSPNPWQVGVGAYGSVRELGIGSNTPRFFATKEVFVWKSESQLLLCVLAFKMLLVLWIFHIDRTFSEHFWRPVVPCPRYKTVRSLWPRTLKPRTNEVPFGGLMCFFA